MCTNSAAATGRVDRTKGLNEYLSIGTPSVTPAGPPVHIYWCVYYLPGPCGRWSIKTTQFEALGQQSVPAVFAQHKASKPIVMSNLSV